MATMNTRADMDPRLLSTWYANLHLPPDHARVRHLHAIGRKRCFVSGSDRRDLLNNHVDLKRHTRSEIYDLDNELNVE